ncbi:MAG: Hsp20/alpha crystallin family protein [Spirosomaceae bacterium]|jgi:HSP20 family molecular chaperone IbpA|nr:Hsp20/alpha crystallin family protein [Spirosomataceae bacterium]
MKTHIQIPQDILASIDYANTVNGGMSEAQTEVTETPHSYDVFVKAPGLSSDSFQIDVVNGHLLIYHLLTLFAERPAGLDNLQTVRTLGRLILPNDVDSERIEARYEADKRLLKVVLPFHPKRHQRRHIEIEK